MKKMFVCCMKPSTPEEEADPPSPITPLPEPPLSRPPLFGFRDLQVATRGWRTDAIVGRGKTCEVYKGCLSKTQQIIAIKRLRKDPDMENRYLREYNNEKSILHELHHENIIEVKGSCHELKELMIVLEFVPKGTLFKRLHDKDNVLSWENRMKIALGAARAIDYIHNAVPGPILHRDIKTTHILIDDEFNAKLIDFGNAIYDPKGEKCKHIVGTEPYTAPEYKRNNTLTTKCDIHGFGVVLLELITGRQALPDRGVRITDWVHLRLIARPNWTKLVSGVIDERIRETVPKEDMVRMVKLATDCVRVDAHERPNAAVVVARLREVSCLVTAPSSSGGGISCLENTVVTGTLGGPEVGESSQGPV